MTDQDLTLLVLVADRSGSMAGISHDMNGGIRTLLAEQAKQPGALIVDIWTFDSIVDHPYDWVRPDDVKADVILPRGSTALNDALGVAIVSTGTRLASMPEDERPGKVIVCVVTDGQENSSQEYSIGAIREMITKQTDEYGWEFMFLAANIDAFATAGQYNLGHAATLQYDATGAGAAGSMAAASAGITRSRMGGAVDFTEDERTQAGAR